MTSPKGTATGIHIILCLSPYLVQWVKSLLGAIHQQEMLSIITPADTRNLKVSRNSYLERGKSSGSLAG